MSFTQEQKNILLNEKQHVIETKKLMNRTKVEDLCGYFFNSIFSILETGKKSEDDFVNSFNRIRILFSQIGYKLTLSFADVNPFITDSFFVENCSFYKGSLNKDFKYVSDAKLVQLALNLCFINEQVFNFVDNNSQKYFSIIEEYEKLLVLGLENDFTKFGQNERLSEI